jgi:hypothetical protein
VTVPWSPPLDAVTTALLELLRGTGRPVYDGSYGGDPLRPPPVYGVLYTLPGNADPIPTMDADWRVVTASWQVSAVSSLRNQAQFARRQFTDRLLARHDDGRWLHDLAVPPGWVCVDRRPDDVLPGTDREGQLPNAIFTAPLVFRLTIAPA